MSRLEDDLKTSHGKSRKTVTILVLLFLCASAGVIGGAVFWTLSDLPSINAIEEYVPLESSKVYSSDGKILAELYYERRTFVPYYKIPDFVKKAFVSIEDVRFYDHPGVDIRGILRALWQDIKAGSIVQGGSTITQQLAKMLFLKPEKSIIRKIKEAIISVQIEKRYTKDEILGLYLNQTFFGTRAFGVEAAAQTYFGKSVDELTIGEAALLATLPKAPSLYSPFRNPEKSNKRRALVLKSMLSNNFITEDEYKEALKEPLPSSPHFRKYEAPYFIEFLIKQLERKYGSDIYSEGYKIYSTIDSKMQKIAEEALRKGIKATEKRVKPEIQAALVAIELRSGHIKAMVGGFDFWETQFNRATQALRQPGSAFKPFVYLAAIEQGMTYEDIIYDFQTTFIGSHPDEDWTPDNYGDKYYGEVTLKKALAKSLNAASVNLASIVGIDNVVNAARRLGIKSTLYPYISIALGSSDLTLIELVSSYSVFATGKKVNVIPYERIENRDRIVVDELFPKYEHILDEDTLFQMKEMLGAVVQEGTGIRAKYLGRTVYGKTGTTNDFRDAWFIGFDGTHVVGVWVGRDDHTPIGNKETGSRAALPIWIEFMKRIDSGRKSN
jgi:penicillin-binding protein 1A